MTDNPMHSMHRHQLEKIRDDLNLIAKGYYGTFGEAFKDFTPLNEEMKRNVSTASYFTKMALESLDRLQHEWSQLDIDKGE